MVLIQSRGKTPGGTRARNLAKQWRSPQSEPEVWKDEWNTTKQELKELYNQLKLMGSTQGQCANPFHNTVPTSNAAPTTMPVTVGAAVQ